MTDPTHERNPMTRKRKKKPQAGEPTTIAEVLDQSRMTLATANILRMTVAAAADTQDLARTCPRRTCREARRCRPKDPRKDDGLCHGAVTDATVDMIACQFLFIARLEGGWL